MEKISVLAKIVIVVLCLNPLTLLGGVMIGGEVNFKCLGDNEFEIRMVVFWDCYQFTIGDPLPPRKSIKVFHNKDLEPALDIGENGEVQLTKVGEGELVDQGTGPGDCYFVPKKACKSYSVYRGRVNLDFVEGGYYLASRLSSRQVYIDNIGRATPNGPILTTYIPEVALSQCLSSSSFRQLEEFYFCLNEPIDFDHSVTNAEDYDSVRYEFFLPYLNSTSILPYRKVRLEHGFSLNNLLGNRADPLRIDPKTGRITGVPDKRGVYLIGVTANFYVDGDLAGKIYRDFYMHVDGCDGAEADFELDDFYCLDTLINISEISEVFRESRWVLGDMDDPIQTSRADRPDFLIPGPGEYSITRIAYGPGEHCHDTVQQNIVIRDDEVGIHYDLDWTDCTKDDIRLSLTAKSTGIPLGELDFEMIIWFDYQYARVYDTSTSVTLPLPEEIYIKPFVNDRDVCADVDYIRVATGAIFNNEFEVEYYSCGGELELNEHFDPRNRDFDVRWEPEDAIVGSTEKHIITVNPDTFTTFVATVTSDNCVGKFTYHVNILDPDTEFLPDSVCGPKVQVDPPPFKDLASNFQWQIFQGGTMIGSRVGLNPELSFIRHGEAQVRLVPRNMEAQNCPEYFEQDLYVVDPYLIWNLDKSITDRTRDSIELVIQAFPEGQYAGTPKYTLKYGDGELLENDKPTFKLTLPRHKEYDFLIIMETEKACSFEKEFTFKPNK